MVLIWKESARRRRRRRQHLREDKGAERVHVHVAAAQRGPGRPRGPRRRIAQILRLIELLVHALILGPPRTAADGHGREALEQRHLI